MQTRVFTNPILFEEVPVDWQLQPIESLCHKVTSGGTPLRANKAFYHNGTIQWVKTGELKDWYIEDTEEKITVEAVQNSSAKILPANTLLMAMYGDGKTITSLGILRNESATNQACCALIVNPAICNYLYLFYALKYHRADFIRIATGGAQRNLSGTLIRNFAVMVPPLSEQQAIAHILGTLDDKIELNRRINETLEAIARVLFKSWFVDFDPVRAKVEGRQPEGMDAETAALFPDGFEASLLEEVPRGWQIRRMGELASISRDGINPGDYPNEIFDHYSIPAFDEGQLPKVETGEQIKSNKFVVPPDAILLSKLNPRIPRVWFPALRDQYRPVCSTEFLVILPKSGIGREYLYAHTSSASFLELFTTLVTGTSSSHQRVRPEDLLNMEVICPSQAIIERFSKVTEPLHRQVAQNRIQSHILAAIRDALLPKLLSGEIRVKEAEKLVEAKI